MTVTLIESAWWLLLILPLAAFAAWWMYRRTRDTLSRPIRWTLTGLRFLSICLAAWLLLQPLLRSSKTLIYPPILAVLQDDSESLVIQRDSVFVRTQYPDLLDAFLSRVSSEELQVDGYRFGAGMATGLSGDSLRFLEEATNLSGALKEAANLYQNQNLGAVVLVSDGIVTAGSNPVYQLDGLGVPVYTVLLGDTTPQRDVRIREVLFNEIAYLNNDMPVKARIQVEGYDAADLQVSLSSQGKVLDTKPLRLGSNKPQAEVDFLVKPETVGLQAFDLTVTRLDGEVTYRNNSQRFFVNVLETRVKVALFAGAAHPDIGALRQVFEREEGYQLFPSVLRAPGVFYEEETSLPLADADLIILHNFPGSSADQATVNAILEQVEKENIPVMAFIGAGADLRAMQPLFKYLALAPQNPGQRSEEIIANFSQQYRQHSTYTFDDRWISWANSAPPLYRPQAAWQPKPNAEVFATAKIRNIPLDYPVFALQQSLGRKNMVFLGENIWRMRGHAYLENEDFEAFDGWIFNLVKWLMANDDQRRFRVEPTKKVFPGRDNVTFRGQAYDDSYNSIPGVDMELTLVDPQGRENQYFLTETNEGQYFLDLGSLPEGSYRYRAEGRKNNVRVGEDRGEFSVGRSGVEHISTRADGALLRQIALQSGGKFYHASELDQLAAELLAQETLIARRDTKPARMPFRQMIWPLVLLLALLGVEWVVRKVNSQV